MTPLQLFGLICIFAVVRVAISIRPGVSAGATTASANSLSVVLREYLDAFIVAGLVALFLITFVVRTFYIPSGSMEPTLQIHDVLLVNEFEYRFFPPHHSDIVVFEPPIDSTDNFIKRLVGAPGDTFEVKNGVVYRNGKALDEPYEAQKPNYALQVRNYGIYVDGQPLDPSFANIPPKSAWSAPNRIPDGYYLMFGDNRNNSEDSHIWGFAQASGNFASGPLKGKPAHFTGHAFLLFWPFNRIGILR